MAIMVLKQTKKWIHMFCRWHCLFLQYHFIWWFMTQRLICLKFKATFSNACNHVYSSDVWYNISVRHTFLNSIKMWLCRKFIKLIHACWDKAIKYATYRSYHCIQNVLKRQLILTQWGWDKISAISYMTFSNAFSWKKVDKFHLRFHLNLFLWFKLAVYQHWLRLWLGADQATSHYPGPMIVSLLTHRLVTRPQWVKHLITFFLH